MGKLSRMAVERVDGVDRPAIRKKFVLVKHEDAAETVEKDYAGAARAVIEAIAKEGVSFTEETVDVLKALVELLELDIDFAAKSEEDDEKKSDDEDKGDDEDTSDEDKSDDDEADVEKTYSEDEVEDAVAKALRAVGVDPETVIERAETTPLRVARSRQPKEQDAGARKSVKKGEGLYAGVIFAKATEPFAGRRSRRS